MSLRSIHSTLFLLLGTLITFGKSPTNSYPFFQGTWEEFQNTAKQLQKPYFIFFHGEDVKTNANIHYWQNDELLFFVDRNYLAYRMDVGEQKSHFLEEYGIISDQSFLFFNSDGQVLGLQEGKISAKKLLSILETIFFQIGDPNWTFYNGRQVNETTPDVIATTKEYVEIKEKIGSSRSEKLQVISDKFAQYALTDISEIQKGHYSILLETYLDKEQAIKDIEKFQRIWKGELWVNIAANEEKYLFQILLGSYSDEQTAGYFITGIERLTEKKVKILPLSTLLN